MAFVCNSPHVSPLLDVSQELPRELWLGTLVLVAGFSFEGALAQRRHYIEPDSARVNVRTATHTR